MKLLTRANLIRATLNASKHFRAKDIYRAKVTSRWLQMIADALLMEYLFESKCVLHKVRITENLNGLTAISSDEELMDWCMRTSDLDHLLMANVQLMYAIPEVREFRNIHSKNGLLIRDEKDNLVPMAKLAKQK